MIIYQSTKEKFLDDVLSAEIHTVIHDLLFDKANINVGDSEMAHLGYFNAEKFKKELHKDTDYFNKKYLPRNAKLVDNPKDYEWSSYKDFLDKRNLVFISKDLIPVIFTNKKRFIKETCKNVQKSDMSRGTLDIDFE